MVSSGCCCKGKLQGSRKFQGCAQTRRIPQCLLAVQVGTPGLIIKLDCPAEASRDVLLFGCGWVSFWARLNMKITVKLILWVDPLKTGRHRYVGIAMHPHDHSFSGTRSVPSGIVAVG